jgi:hypothetical protein
MDEQERTLRFEIPPSGFDVDPADGTLTQQLDKYGGGWRVLPGYQATCYFESSIDLSGYAMEDLTFVPFASYTQMAQPTAYNEGAGIMRADIITTVPMDPALMLNTILVGSAPGMLTPMTIPGAVEYEAVNPDVVMHSRVSFASQDTTFPGNWYLSEQSVDHQSSLEPTAADKLYLLSVVVVLRDVNPSPGDPTATPPIPPGNPFGDYLSNPARRVLIPGKWVKEPDLEYMMRLKRSYELANQV